MRAENTKETILIKFEAQYIPAPYVAYLCQLITGCSKTPKGFFNIVPWKMRGFDYII